MIGDFLKKHVWADDPAAAPAKPATQPAAAPAAIPAGGFPVGQVAAVSSVTALGPAINPAFVEALRKAIFGKQTALTTLLEAADKLNAIIPDAATRYRAAWATSSQGRTVQQVAAAADIHVADIKGEVMRFEAAVKQQLGAEAATLETRATTLASQIQSAQQQIEAAQQRIAELTQSIGTLTQQHAEASAQAAAKRVEIETTTQQFEAAAASVRNELEGIKSVVLTSIG